MPRYHLTIHSIPMTYILLAFPFYSEVMCSRSNVLSGRARIKSLFDSRARGEHWLSCSSLPLLGPQLLRTSVYTSPSPSIQVGPLSVYSYLSVYFLAVYFLPISELHTHPPSPQVPRSSFSNESYVKLKYAYLFVNNLEFFYTCLAFVLF